MTEPDINRLREYWAGKDFSSVDIVKTIERIQSWRKLEMQSTHIDIGALRTVLNGAIKDIDWLLAENERLRGSL